MFLDFFDLNDLTAAHPTLPIPSLVRVSNLENGKTAIVITELPYQVVKSRLIEHIGELARDKKIEGITGINDYTDKSEMRVVVELKRDVQPHKILNQLLKHTQLRLNFGCILLSLVERGRGPKVLGLRGMLQEYIDHRREIITRRTKFEVNRAKQRAHILEGLQIAVINLDEVIRTIRASANTDQARSALMSKFGFTGPQTEAILNMQLRQLAALERQKIIDEAAELERQITEFKRIIADEAVQRQIISDELEEVVGRYGDDRRSEILLGFDGDVSMEDLIPEEEMVVTLTAGGYIKRTKSDNYRQQHRGGKGVKGANLRADDVVEHFFVTTTHHWLLFFTNKGRVYRTKAYEVLEAGRDTKGQHVANLLALQPDEQVAQVLDLKDYKQAPYLVLATREGLVKKTALDAYDTARTGGIIAIKLREGDELVSAMLVASTTLRWPAGGAAIAACCSASVRLPISACTFTVASGNLSRRYSAH